MADGRSAGGHGVAPAAALLAAAGLLAACSPGSDPGRPDPTAPAVPPAPPAACLLDTEALRATTGLTWTPDPTTASDTRCVYDPGRGPADGEAAGNDFVAVDVAAATADVPAELDTLAAVCEAGSRGAVEAGDGGFVCRFQGGSVFAALVVDGRLVTVGASAVPAGTTSARLVLAVDQQLRALALTR